MKVVRLDNKCIWCPDEMTRKELLEICYRDLLMVDAAYVEAGHRYGLFNEKGGWRHVPFDEFPAEFKTHLLLLGIS